MMVNASFDGERLRRRREALGWRHEDLAHHADVSAQQIRNLENGRTTRPRRLTVKAIEQALLIGERARK